MSVRNPRVGLIGVAIVSAALLAGCDDVGMGWMMGQPAAPARFQSNGERIYFTGASASGRPITFAGGDMRFEMHGGGCAACHGANRRGGIRMMPRFWLAAPTVTAEALFGEHSPGSDGHGNHAAYTDRTVGRAITEGVDPSENPLDKAMPRWRMHPDDLRDLVAYLRQP